MLTLQRTPLVLLAGLSLALAACKGSSSPDPVPVNDPPVSNPPPVSAEKVTLTGHVTDMPIPNATVIVTVNGQTFQAPLPTDANGAYEVEIESTDADALVTLEAFDPNGAVRFSAIADTFGAIDAAADGQDRVAGVNVTNVTTAQVVLAERLTDDGSIDSAEELVDAVSRVATEDLLELSAAIKLVVENIDGVVLPPDAEDTLDLAEAIVEGATTFLADVAATAPGALETAVDLVLTDGNATLPFSTETVPGVYVSQDNLQLFAILPAGYGFTVSYERDLVTMFDWQVDENGVLTLWYAGDQPHSESVTLLDRNADVVNVVVREAGSAGEGNPATAWYRPFADGFTDASIPGTYSTIGESGHLTVFEADGTGYDMDLLSGIQDSPFAWSVDADGVVSLTDDASGEITYARRLAGSTDERLKLLVWEFDAAGTLDHVAVIDVLRNDGAVSASVSDATELLLAGNTYAVTESDEIGLFTFAADGRFLQLNQYIDGQTVELRDDEGEWTIDANGGITLTWPDRAETDTATVVQGLGEDFMVVQTEADSSAMLQVTRVVPVAEAALMIGSFTITDEAAGAADGTVRFLDDFTGVHIGNDGVGEDFEWGLTSDGRIVVETASGFDNETITLHLLAGSGGDLLRFVAVHRDNGALRPHDPSTGEAPDTLQLLTLIRTQ